MKLLLIAMLVVAAVTANAQLDLGLGLHLGRTGPPPPEFFLNVILRSEAQKVLNTTDLPTDLQQRVQQTLDNARLGFDSCNNISALIWLQMRCVALQLSLSKAELKAIEDEAKARAAQAAQATEKESVVTATEGASV